MQPTMDMQIDPERRDHNDLDHVGKDMKSSQVEDRGRKQKGDLNSILEDATASLEPLEPAVEPADPKKVEKCDTVRTRSPRDDRIGAVNVMGSDGGLDNLNHGVDSCRRAGRTSSSALSWSTWQTCFESSRGLRWRHDRRESRERRFWKSCTRSKGYRDGNQKSGVVRKLDLGICEICKKSSQQSGQGYH